MFHAADVFWDMERGERREEGGENIFNFANA